MIPFQKDFLKLVVGVVFVAGLAGAGLALVVSRAQADKRPPFTATPTDILSVTDAPAPAYTLTATRTETATPTLTAMPSVTPTATPTLSTRVVQMTVINPDVTLDARPSLLPTGSPTPLPTLVVPSPGATLAYLPTGAAAPMVGWLRYGVDHPALQKVGQWELFTSTYRSAARRYLYSDTANARLTLRFLGAAVRVRYARLYSYGVFEVSLDGRVLTTVDAFLPKSTQNGDFVTTEVFSLAYGWHMLDITRLDRRNPASAGGFVAIDGIDVYQNGPEPTITPTNPSPAPTFTATPAPVQITAVTLTVAYDQNGNKAVEPTEGVRDLPVQLISADTNRVVAAGVTDGQGYLRLEAVGTAPLRLVVPYFNRFWDIVSGGRGQNTRCPWQRSSSRIGRSGNFDGRTACVERVRSQPAKRSVGGSGPCASGLGRSVFLWSSRRQGQSGCPAPVHRHVA